MTPRVPTPFAAFTRERRVELGMTQIEMAERFGIPFNYISQLENGRIGAPRKYLAHFAAALGISELEVMQIAGLMPPPEEREPVLSASEQRLLMDWRQLDPGDREVVRALMNALRRRAKTGRE
jgi:transcriptional regulator with XRE-family HTH domain